MTSIVTNGIIDPEAGVYQQRVFSFESAGLSIVFHVPIAGVSINYNGDANSWKNNGALVDMWQYKFWSLGVLDKRSWIRNQDGSVSVHYTNGNFCGSTSYQFNSNFGYSRSSWLTLVCGSNSNFIYSYSEGPICRRKNFLFDLNVFLY